jgi:hypothetical protein
MKKKIGLCVREMMMSLFLFSSPLFLACGPDGGHQSISDSQTGIYQASLVFPSEVPRIEPSLDASVSKLINGGINCSESGIATLTFSFFSADNDPIANGSCLCEDHQTVITDIPAGSGIILEVVAEDKSGTALLRGEERDIIIRANETTDGGDIKLYPANSLSVAAGDEPKTLVFDWEHIRFSENADHYLLQVDPDGNSGFDTIDGADHITDTHYELAIPVHLTDWGRALYRVVAVNALREPVGTSATIDLLTTVAAEEVIGYFKVGNTESNDYFGESVTLSGDGKILAVGAYLEDSAVTGINGDQNDNSAEEAGAVYVFSQTDDGFWNQEAYLKASNTDDGDHFGGEVVLSADGTTLAIRSRVEASASTGINGDQNDNSAPEAGAVYLFVRSASGVWHQQAYIKASNTEAGDRFSTIALSADGNTLAVGANREDSVAVGINGDESDNSAQDAGAVYLFNRNAGGQWEQAAYVKAGNTDAEDRFGIDVALSGDGRTLAVGAIHEDSAATGINGDDSDNSLENAGAVYIFSRDTSGQWEQASYIKAGNPDAEDWFGYPVVLSTDGNTLSVGAYREDSATIGINGDPDDNSADAAGAVYLFTRNSNTGWHQQAYIKASNTDIDDRFGYRLDLSSDGNLLAVGTSYEDSAATGINNDLEDNNATDTGAVYLFTRNANGNWQHEAYIKAVNTDIEDHFGFSLSLSADGATLVVGANGEDSGTTGINGNQNDNSTQDAGAVYLY